jgi:L-iditol 2-dehydrogenase
MQAILVNEIGRFEVQDISTQTPGPNDVLIQTEVTGLCRTDLKLIRKGHRDLTLPRVPGEEVVGSIVKTGDQVKDYQTGERVYVYPGTPCNACPPCQAGAENLCKDMRIMGFHRDGGFADYVTAPAASLIKVPKTLTPDQAVFAEPLSCCLNGLELGQLKTGETIGIWGAGPAGSLLNRAAKAKGATPINIDPDVTRAQRINGKTQPDPETHFDVAIVAVGANDAYEAALKQLKPRGRLVVFSGLAPDHCHMPCDFNQLHYLEQTIIGAYGCSYRHGVHALELLASGAVKVNDLISHRLPLEELDKGLDIVANRQGMKVLLYPNHNTQPVTQGT